MTETLSPALTQVIEDLAYEVLKHACALKLTIATAESCTGGMLASLLTDVDGCGHAFERGFVAYTNEAKRDMLGVDAGVLTECGAVSRPVALAMAQGALDRSRADIALSITGFAGRAGPDDEPGLVHFALARRSVEPTHRIQHFGDIGRGGVRLGCLEIALSMLRANLEQGVG